MTKNEFIAGAVKALYEYNNQEGYRVISKETLSSIMEQYINIYNPPPAPSEKRFSEVFDSNKGLRLVKV